ncbi:MAG: Small GTP-binding protein [candidate division WWE3 bacterium GW2011_GWF2_41_45]|uniref:50S ribosomal subunit assembly factor BipA n=3 Tax=Katanobacteria TaxID=422282 RepID=A0A1F4W345_UNCKA|nr:MAG: Small GTP-binding protein [candidate division WWE3 bacterium GW2011_GWC2_41_23]KKS10652.1 MAG: Small GTP-binding protein [candidate division WWE3 bacterium GW2011_GWF2_41_45]KKS12337.1 MAG: Small GTP-binding protein [candidate division WWE3 bacterium GW2011_GWF1_41_53]KKS20411.1 MAG: Small GTP-binding protein [candidate division WWE3 bacterium GW2011_GWE1_41_72]KKS28291.1 MAG: Small GTP-binding protein [candidate division WWE3 bacterium GW2011_GWC1_42_102]KKS30343.1 MAG: Small GTP-bind
MKLRNIAIIAHVDHGKTTIVDGLLKQSKTFRDNESEMSQDLILDSNDQERERGITILAKNTAVIYKDTKINIIDTPGHSDFGGEVERTLNMADGALLVVDSQEGPMPQTKFVLKKALELGLKIIVVVNKIDKKDALIKNSLHKIYDLFLELATHESQLEFPILYAIGREGKAWKDFDFSKITELTAAPADFTDIFEAILKYVPQPETRDTEPFQMLISTLDWDNYKGKYAIGRVTKGVVKAGTPVVLMSADGKQEKTTVEKVFVNQGLKRIETAEGVSGDIVSLTGVKNASIGDTVCDASNPKVLPTIKIEDPTLAISIGPNTSPFLGKEGKFLTGRQILERIERELQTNVAMKFRVADDGQYVLSGRGELHLSVFLETLRREGFELSVGKPRVITKIIDGVEMEPTEELTIDVENAHVGAIKSELGRRHGVLISQEELTSASSRLTFEIATRGILGLRSVLLTLSKGTAILSSMFVRYEKMGHAIPKLRKGAIVASHSGKAVPHGLVPAHEKGPVFIGPQTMVYQGMIVGLNGRDEDVEVNVCKEKQLTNNRSSGENGITIPPPVEMSLEQYLGLLEDDELLEITPESLKLRKKILDPTVRRRTAARAL